MNPQEDISAIAALDQPIRRDMYRLLVDRGTWIGRDEAAEALDVPRSVAAFHLDKLTDAGIVEVKFERLTGRSGPGAGRPAKLYRRTREETAASIPQRHYELAGELLARAIGEAGRTQSPVDERLSEIAREAGRQAGTRSGVPPVASTGGAARRAELFDALAAHGYEPVTLEGGEIALRNCPFHRLAEQERSLVCGMNLDYLTGCLEGVGADDLEARLDPQPGYCCVRLSEAS